MHSVTSNAVARVLSYSTEEVFTGSYWLDGKKIYKKTLTISNITASTSVQNIAHNISFLDNIITLYGNCNITNRKRFFPYFDTDNICNVVFYDTTNLSFWCGYTVSNLNLTLLYTKITD